MPQPAEQLVGRAAELVALDEALSELQRGRPAALELAGEPGIGKTRLLSELGASADERGLLVLSGSASELEGDLPFWVFVDALDEYVEGLAPRRLDGMDADARAELGHVLPSLASGGAAPAVERFRTHRAMRQLLETLAADKPLVLLLDDLHWADSGSVELLGTLLRRPPGAAVLLAMAVRPRQIAERLSAALVRARGDRHADTSRARGPVRRRVARSCSATPSRARRRRSCSPTAAATRSTSSSCCDPRRPESAPRRRRSPESTCRGRWRPR